MRRKIDRRSFLTGVAAGGAALAVGRLAPGAETRPAARPNVVLIITDDQGYGELGCHGNEVLQTPNLDRLYAESVRLTNFHASPTCSPTRASLMTGRHEFRSGVTHTILERERLAPSAVTLAQVLKRAGYKTAIFGKWHLGDEEAYQPQNRGFDEAFIHGAGGIGQAYRCSCGDAPGNKYFDPWIRHNGTFVKTSGYCTDVFFGKAAEWIGANRDRPFFAYITTNAPHSPFVVAEKYKQPYLKAGLKDAEASYYGMIANIDENVGKLTAKLDGWGLARDTLLIFMTDNGHSVRNLYNAGMRGAKGSVYEGGVRVPFFVRWPAKLEAGVDVGALTAHVDILPTLAELCGGKCPEGVKLDGRSMVPVLLDPKADWPDRYLVHHVGRWGRGQAAKAKYGNFAVRNTRFKLVRNRELYDMPADPGEETNVIDKHPQAVAELRKVYEQWWAEVLPCLVNENVPMAAEPAFHAAFRKQFGNQQPPKR